MQAHAAATPEPSPVSTHATHLNDKGLRFTRRFTQPGIDPFDGVTWVLRDAVITGADGKVYFEQRQVEFPATWSQTAVAVVAQKYFRGALGSTTRERSVKQMLSRVADTITGWGRQGGYFAAAADEATFRAELIHLMLHQKMAFNSPVWFNVGIQPEPQASACYINSVDDSMDSILTLAKTEGMLFKHGSGTGTNLSNLRSDGEELRNGGTASGPLSFMRGFDAFAGAIKSGGSTRRAAKMVILNVDHPDVVDFIECKATEEKKAWALIDAGYDGSFNVVGGAYDSVGFQNANHSVRVSDDFMRAVLADAPWSTRAVVDGRVVQTFKAKDILRKMAEAAWVCGDPGIQFDTTINAWHTCPAAGRINASNPCCFVGDTLVDTSEGRIRIAELAAKAQRGESLPLALSYDTETRLPVAKPIQAAWKAGEARTLVRVSTVRGLAFLCTPEHRWYLRDGTAVEARALTPGDRLLKLAVGRNTNRSNRRVIYHRATPASPRGQQWFNRWLWQEAFGEIPDGHHIHHKNGDPTDDRLSNYELRLGVEHASEHSRGAGNGRFMDLTPAALVEVWEAVAAQPKQTHKASAAVTPARWNAYVKANALVGAVPMAGSPTDGGRIQGMAWADFEKFIDDHRTDVNDAVAQVEFLTLDTPIPVFDITVAGTHRFGIGCEGIDHSVVVSNSEYMFLDDTACNLASLNLRKFRDDRGGFDTASFREACAVTITAMEILVGNASYPTPKITRNSHDFRPLGLGYANLGALLMSRGLAYDSAAGRDYAAAVTSLMCAAAYAQSAQIASALGPFKGHVPNAGAMLDVVEKHADANRQLLTDATSDARGVAAVAQTAWADAVARGINAGFRNSQVTVLAPTGTIAFLMDCDTTGVEPDLALVKYKRLVGGGTLKIVNQTVPEALTKLGYDALAIDAIVAYIADRDTIEGAPGFKAEHLPVFDCAFRSNNGTRSIHYMGHLRMMAAVQPFLSGAISKTVNLPTDCTIEDIEDAYIQAWKMGLKAIAVYRDGCKRTQPLSTSATTSNSATATPATVAVTTDGPPPPRRHKLTRDRHSMTHKFAIGGHEGYITVGLYADGTPGEIFVRMAKEGSAIAGLVDSFATAVSIALQHGAPLTLLVDKFKGTRFEPSGFTGNADIPLATSIMDYVFRWLERFAARSVAPAPVLTPAVAPTPPQPATPWVAATDAPPCHECGTLMVRNGACHKCPNCGSTSGCS